MLIENTIFGIKDKVKIAMDRLKEFEPKEGYYLAFSGGKDSIVIKKLADMAKVKYEAVYNVTTIDPPELIYFMREYHKDVIFDYPKIPFLIRMVEKGFPQRQRRWCCAEYKERGGAGREVVTGIRWEESNKRRLRQMKETCFRDRTKRYLNVIIEWTGHEVWRFIKDNNMPYCELYDQGYKRIGCLFCPLATRGRKLDVERYPGWVKLFIIYFRKLYDRKKERGLLSVDRWKDGKEMFLWWINENRKKHIKDQLVMFE